MSASDATYRIKVGSEVKDRLALNPSAFKIPSNDLDIFVVRDFLTQDECGRLIALIDGARIPSQLLAPTEDPEFRTSESCNMDPDERVVRRVEAKITGLMDIEPANGETIQGQRYAVGQQFKAHHDFFYADQPYWQEMARTGGQRTWTAMIFLNQPEGGGQTWFETAGVKVSPKTGNLLAWNNMNAIGEPNPFSLHRGMPVTASVKYIVTKWYRERPWSLSHAPTY